MAKMSSQMEALLNASAPKQVRFPSLFSHLSPHCSHFLLQFSHFPLTCLTFPAARFSPFSLFGQPPQPQPQPQPPVAVPQPEMLSVAAPKMGAAEDAHLVSSLEMKERLSQEMKGRQSPIPVELESSVESPQVGFRSSAPVSGAARYQPNST